LIVPDLCLGIKFRKSYAFKDSPFCYSKYI
jgi:hypothetical protein